MNVINWETLQKNQLKTDLCYPEFHSAQIRNPIDICWAIDQQIIKNFSSPSDKAISINFLDKKTNVDNFFSIVPQLSLVQFCFLLGSSLFSQIFDEEYFATKAQLGNISQIKSLIPVVTSLNQDFLAWLHEKCIRAQDLASFVLIKPEQLEKFLGPFLKLNPSKSDGVQILELLIDLILLEKPDEFIFRSLQQKNASAALVQLKELRYPQTANRDHLQSQINLSWPQNVNAKFQRRGDRAGFDLQVFVGNSNELKKTINNLEKVIEEWKSQSPTT